MIKVLVVRKQNRPSAYNNPVALSDYTEVTIDADDFSVEKNGTLYLMKNQDVVKVYASGRWLDVTP